MKITREYEVDDIDSKGNKLHSTLFMALTLTAVTWPKVEKDASDDDVAKAVDGQVALFLNMIDKAGFNIAPKEEIPTPFRSILS